MSERRSSVDKKNHSRVSAGGLSSVSSIQKRSYTKKSAKKVEVTCITCRFTKFWSQAQWDRHVLKVHGYKNEVHIGAEKSAPKLF